jgi:protein-disulfide isomerase
MDSKTIVSGMMVLCAVVMTGLVARRELHQYSAAQASRVAADTVTPVDNWREIAAAGSSIGPAAADVILTEFSDYQCPFCKRFYEVAARLRERYPGQVASSYRHFPLDRIHPHAKSMALAAECAGIQSAFEAFHNAVYASAESIGVITPAAFAKRAAVPDLESFSKCLDREEPAARIKADSVAGRRIGVLGTPTIMVNGWLIHGPPTFERLSALIERELASRKQP